MDEDHLPGRVSILGLDEEVRRVFRVYIKVVIGPSRGGQARGPGSRNNRYGARLIKDALWPFWVEIGAFNSHSPRCLRTCPPLEDPFADVLILDEGNNAHRALASFGRLRIRLGVC